MWRLVAPAMAFALLGASFLRAGAIPMVVLCGMLVLLLGVPRWWAARVAQLALVLAAIRWIWVTWTIATVRAAHGIPVARLLLILGAVAAFTLLAALVFRSRRLKAYYGLESSPVHEPHG